MMRHSRTRIVRGLMRKFNLRPRTLQCGYLGALLMLLVYTLVRVMSGTPYRAYYFLREAGNLLPLGIYTLINLCFTLGLGFAFGIFLSQYIRSPKCRTEIYRCGMLFVLLCVLWYAAYPLIVRGNMLFAAVLCLTAVWLLGLLCLFSMGNMQPLSYFILFLFLFWLAYLIFTLLRCLLW